MSLYASRLRSIQDNITRIQKSIAQLNKQEAQAAKSLASEGRMLNQARSPSTAEYHARRIEKYQNDIANLVNRRAREASNLAKLQEDLARTQSQYFNEQAGEAKNTQEIIRKLEHAATYSAERGFAQVPVFESSRFEIEYTAFVSHASEDKAEIAAPLAKSLSELGHRIWYDEFTLKIGDSLRRSIDKGLASSRFGIVVLSQDFFAKNWPQYELDGLVAKEQEGHKVILPLWHRVSKQDVLKYSPTLADRLALSTANFTIEELAHKIHEVLSGE